MFIVSKRNFLVRLKDGSAYRIRKDYVGEIPDEAAKSRLVQSAIAGGLIFTPKSHKDKDLIAGDEKAKETEASNDIRPDAGEKTRKK